jgi:hypothetical protein
MKKKVQIDENLNNVHETFSKEEYDRTSDKSLFERKDWKEIGRELFYFKINEMKSHVDSISNINLS